MNQGTITLKKGFWRIECSPEPMIKLRRLFKKLHPVSAGVVELSVTPENSYDLMWFCQRYEMTLVNPDELIEQAEEFEAQARDVEDILGGKISPPEFDLALPLRSYQQMAVAVVLRTRSLLLADEVGLGKSATAIGALAAPGALPALVVTPTHLPTQWQRELNRFAPGLTTHILQTGTPYDVVKKGKLDRAPDVFISNYHKLAGWSPVLAGTVKSVIFDEVQELRHGVSTNKGQAAFEIAEKATLRCGLSATPIFNYGGEFWNIMQALKPGVLGTEAEFLREWCTGYRSARVKNPKAFGEYLRSSGLMLRRTRTDVQRELPALSVIPHHIDADLGAIDRVADAAAELARIILKQGDSYRGESLQASEQLSVQLRHATGVAKSHYVAEFVRMLLGSEQKVVLYGWHRDVYNLWLSRLPEFNPMLYTGSESAKQKEAAKDRFVSGDCRLLMMSLRSGIGLDQLQYVCRTVVFGELDWSPGVLEQCIGRVYRDGQPDPVLAYYLLSDYGSDPIMADVLGVKKQQIDGIRDPAAPLVETLQVDPQHIRRLARSFLEQRGLEKELTHATVER